MSGDNYTGRSGYFTDELFNGTSKSFFIQHYKPKGVFDHFYIELRALSKDLYARGFKFVGSTICYAFMQAAGLVNDHRVGCYRHQEIVNSY